MFCVNRQEEVRGAMFKSKKVKKDKKAVKKSPGSALLNSEQFLVNSSSSDVEAKPKSREEWTYYHQSDSPNTIHLRQEPPINSMIDAGEESDKESVLWTQYESIITNTKVKQLVCDVNHIEKCIRDMGMDEKEIEDITVILHAFSKKKIHVIQTEVFNKK